MKQIPLKIKQLPHAKGLPLPKYMTEHAAGMDLVAAVEQDVVLNPGDRKLIPTGLIMEIPEGYEVQLRPRSGLALKFGITLPNSPGTIDADYRGEVQVIMLNAGTEAFTIKRGERICQAILAPFVQAAVEEVTEVGATARGAGGFGSTGK
jgi:dUTP pyrophosphatase